MTNNEFNNVVYDQLKHCKDILIQKGGEYAQSEDRLDHFKHSAQFMRMSPKKALFSFLAKHLVSIADMCSSDKKFEFAKWNEKITDSINYLILLKAIIEEEEDEKDRS